MNFDWKELGTPDFSVAHIRVAMWGREVVLDCIRDSGKNAKPFQLILQGCTSISWNVDEHFESFYAFMTPLDVLPYSKDGDEVVHFVFEDIELLVHYKSIILVKSW